MLVNRLAGLLVALAGMVLLLAVIPANTETVDYGWMRPQTVPNACAVALVAFGLLQALLAGKPVRPDMPEVLRVVMFAALAALALWAMDAFGFAIVAPAFALVTMLLVGERRAGWLAAGTLAVPLVIWLVAVQLLDRTLP